MAEYNQSTNQQENVPGSTGDIVAESSGSAKTCRTRVDETKHFKRAAFIVLNRSSAKMDYMLHVKSERSIWIGKVAS